MFDEIPMVYVICLDGVPRCAFAKKADAEHHIRNTLQADKGKVTIHFVVLYGHCGSTEAANA